MDCTNFRILELSLFSSRWYFHKFNGPAIRYDVPISLKNGTLIWTRRPFKCGAYNDLSTLNLKQKFMLNNGKCVVADEEYSDAKVLTAKFEPVEVKVLNNHFIAKHKIVKGGLKRFQAPSFPFGYGVD